MRLNPGVPLELERIINKALEKDRNLRYQSAADIRTDLQRLKPDTESGRSAVTTSEVGSWRGLKSLRARWVATGTIMLTIGLAASGWLLFSRKAQALTDKDAIVLGDFDNKTGDAVFDDTLRQGLSVQLARRFLP